MFEFFEEIAVELTGGQASRIITHTNLQMRQEDSSSLEDLKRQLKVENGDEAIQRAVEVIQKHFEEKGASAPFSYDVRTGRFTATDAAFLSFIKEMKDIRSSGGKSRDFECKVADRFRHRATGAIHRVGHPRDRMRTVSAFNRHLVTLGFDKQVLRGREKDGGLDIMWLLPLGTIPHRPIVFVQCKNAEFDCETADAAVGSARRSLDRHAGFQPSVHVPCVLFNDYIYSNMLPQKRLEFVPLGLTDLAIMRQSVAVEFI